ncbi:MAG: hypothetical protein WC980_00005 [Candidatus Brocadiia bacterium]
MRQYFFGELELTLDWFTNQCKKQISHIGDKFNGLLHTETGLDLHIHSILCDADFAQYFKSKVAYFKDDLGEYQESIKELNTPHYPEDIFWPSEKLDLIKDAQQLKKFFLEAINHLDKAYNLLRNQQINGVRKLVWDKLLDGMTRQYELYHRHIKSFDVSKIKYTGNRETEKERCLREANNLIVKPTWQAEALIRNFRAIKNSIDTTKPNLHIFGNAGLGKTHSAANICAMRLKDKLPALFLNGKIFTGTGLLNTQLLDNLDIPRSYNLNDFLSALDSAAEAYHTRIPIIIDALNEATQNGEFSNIWRRHLSSLVNDIGRHKNIVLITTCRTTYKPAIWDNQEPPNIAYTYGLAHYNIEEASKKYFDFYKIKATPTSSALSQFHNPLYLRIFCESQNKDHQVEKNIYIGDRTIFDIFDAYLDQCNKSVCNNLDLFRTSNVLKNILKNISKTLWEQNERHISFDKFTRITDGQGKDKLVRGSSIANAILNEGLLICRDWSDGTENVSFTYDFLGGYLIARYLVDNFGRDLKKFVRLATTTKKLFGPDYKLRHPLSEDIGRCLAALIPSMAQQYLHNLTDNTKALDLSVRALFEIPPSSIDKKCIGFMEKLFKFPGNRKALFDLAIHTLDQIGHPFNALFWSKQLRKLSIPERDISWTEFIRENASNFGKTISDLENICEQTDLPSDKTAQQQAALLAEHIMWGLTSTSHSLRDKATKALYWYGRKFPKNLLDLTINSLSINDTYVPERMLAASYGVAMALHNDLNNPNFSRTILPQFAQNLYQLMFAGRAPYSTTHILIRDYARYTIEIALMRNKNLLSAQQIQRIRPPFKDGGIRKWGREQDRNKDEYKNGNCPFGMDFDNYTLGRLLPDRQNYDFKNNGYVEVKSNMWWRIYQLGYSLEKFGEIDKWIPSSNSRSGFEQPDKIDRYGKKYCWIAFYELAGYRKDKGLLKYRWAVDGERISDADIDPSFPDEIETPGIIKTDYLKGNPKELHKWIQKGPMPNMANYLITRNLTGLKSQWVLLQGDIAQENYTTCRGILVSINGFFIRNIDLKTFNKNKSKLTKANSSSPETESDYYTFAGEIPWCETFPFAREKSKIQIPVGTKLVRYSDVNTKIVYKANGIELTNEQLQEFLKITRENNESRQNGSLNKLALIKSNSPKTRTETIYIEIPVELPVRKFCWESYHSMVNPGQNICIPSKELAQELALHITPQSFDMLDKRSEKASVTMQWGDLSHNGHRLIYLRKDLLDSYLKIKNYSLFWVIDGERRYRPQDYHYISTYPKKYGAPYVYFRNINTYKI